MLAPSYLRPTAMLRFGLATLAAICLFAGGTGLGQGAEPLSPQRVEEQLAAGEFAPALAAARQIPSASERDDRLAQVAAAQARAGDRDAAFTTLGSLSDDRRRSAAIDRTRQITPDAGARGGAQADFDSLIELITSTVRPTTWDEVGGPGSIQEFRNGVFVDAGGVLKRALAPQEANGLAVARLEAIRAGENADSRLASPMRKVSLTRLEKHVQLRLAAGRPPDDEMMNLAGLEKIRYVLVYPQTQDLVLAGPAGPWRTDDEGRQVSRVTGRPILQLDDLVVLFRYLTATPGATFGCSINPTQQGLARTKQFAEQSSATPLRRGQRGAWLKTLRDSMGRQTISVEGIDPRTRVARVLVEADYRMKLVGMGLEPGTADVPSYLDLVHVPRGQAPPPLDVLRWWFTLKYDVVRATGDRMAFEIGGPGAQVLSENEFLTAQGRRVQTGQSQPTNQEFANRFTQHFAALGEKYPVYADLQNIFDLALVAALVESQKLDEQVGWHMTCFGDPRQYKVALGRAPQSVESVINCRLVNGKHLIVGVSGGVLVQPYKFVASRAIKTDHYGALEAQRNNSAADELPLDAWWWD
jgi:Protein of unknown function (DUF1598)